MNPYGKLIPALLLAAGLGTLAAPVFAESGCSTMSAHDYRHRHYSKTQQKGFEDFHAGARSAMGNKHRSGMHNADKMPAPDKS